MVAGRGDTGKEASGSGDPPGDRLPTDGPSGSGGDPASVGSGERTARRARKARRMASKRDRAAERTAARRERKARRTAARRDRAAEREAARRERTARRRAAKREREAVKVARQTGKLAARARRLERRLERRRRAKMARQFGTSIARRRRRLRGIAEIRSFLRTNTTPVFVVSPTPFNLLGLERWIHDLYFLVYYDPFDGAHPRVFAPPRDGWREFRSVEEIERAVLAHPDVAAFVAARGPGGRALLLGPDAESERLATEIGLEAMLPSAKVRARISGRRSMAGRDAARDGSAAPASRRDVVLPAVATRRGTLVGPLMAEIVGDPSLTPDPDGRCGTELWPKALDDRRRRRARRLVRRAGDRLAKLGFRGAFEASVRVDRPRPRLAAVRPRVTGAASLTNASAGAYADVPLLCFHLLEHLGVDYRVDLRDIRSRWAEAELDDPWTQVVLKDLEDRVEVLTAAPRTGIWRLGDDATPAFDRAALDWHGLLDEAEAFLMRVVPPGEFRYRGVDLATLVVRGRLRGDDGELDERGRAWAEGLRSSWSGLAVVAPGGAGTVDPG